jgi:hypothetical protein
VKEIYAHGCWQGEGVQASQPKLNGGGKKKEGGMKKENHKILTPKIRVISKNVFFLS